MPERQVKIVITGEDRTKKAFANIGKRVKSVGKSMISLGAKLTASVTAPLVGFATLSVKAAIDYESAFAGVLKTTDGLGDSVQDLTEDGKKLYEGFRDLSKEIPVAATELAGIGEIAGQLGVPKEQILAFTETIANISVATNLTSEQAATDMARFANVMGTPIEEVDRLGAAIVALGNQFPTTESEILNMSMRLTGMASVVGLTEAQVLGFATAMSAVGIRAEAGGSALSRVFARMQAAVASMSGEVVNNDTVIAKHQEQINKLQQQLTLAAMRQGEFTDKTKESTKARLEMQMGNWTAEIQTHTAAMAELAAENGKALDPEVLKTYAETAGMTIPAFAKLFKTDAAGAMQVFIEGLANTKEVGGDVLGLLENLEIKGIRERDTLLRLAGATGTMNDALIQAQKGWTENTALTEEARKRYATTESQLKLLKNSVTDLMIELGNALLPIIRDVVAAVRPWIERFTEMDDQQKKIVLIVGAAVAAIGPLVTILGVVATVVGALLSPVGLVIAAIVALGVAFVKSQGGIEPTIQTLKDLWVTITTGVQDALDGLAESWYGTVLPAFVAAELKARELKDAYEEFRRQVAGKFMDALKSAKNLFGRLSDALGRMKGLLQTVAGGFSAIAGAVGIKLPAWMTPGSAAPLEGALYGIGAALKSLVGHFSDFGYTASKAMKNVGKGLMRFVEALTGIVSLQKAMAGGAGFAGVGGFIEQFKQVAVQIVAAIQYIQDVFSYNVIKKLQNTAKRVKVMMDVVIQDFSDIKAIELPDMDAWRQSVVTIVSHVVLALQEMKQQFRDWGLENASKTAEYAEKILGFIKPAIDSLAKLKDYKAIENLPAIMASLQYSLGQVVTALVKMAKSFRMEGLEHAAAFAEAAKKIVAAIKPAVEGITALATWGPIASLETTLDWFTARFIEVIEWLSAMASAFEIEGIEAAGKFFDATKKIVGAIKPGIEGITALTTWEPIASLEMQLDWFTARFMEVVDWLSAMASSFALEGVEHAGVFFDAAKKIVAAIKPGVEGIAALADWEVIGTLEEKLDWFTARLIEVVEWLAASATVFDLEGIEAAGKLFDAIKKIISIVKPAVQMFDKLAEYSAIEQLPTTMRILAGQLEIVVETLREVAQRFTIEGLEHTVAFSGAVDTIMAGMKKALTVMKDLLKLPASGDIALESALDYFVEQLDMMVVKLGDVATSMETEGLKQAKRFHDVAVKIEAAVNAGLSAIVSMGERAPSTAAMVLQRFADAVDHWLGVAVTNARSQLAALIAAFTAAEPQLRVAAQLVRSAAYVGAPAGGGASAGNTYQTNYTITMQGGDDSAAAMRNYLAMVQMGTAPA